MTSLNRFEFVEALLLVALAKFGVYTPPGLAVKRKKGRGETTRTASDAIRVFLRDFVAPTVKELGTGEAREALREEETKYILIKHLPRLRRVFMSYASHKAGPTDEFGNIRNSTMTKGDFIKVLKASRLLSERRKLSVGTDHTELTIAEARRAFSGSQLDDDHAIRYASTRDIFSLEEADNDNSESLVMSEFLDALARVAVLKWTHGELTAGQKVVKCIEAIANLDLSLRTHAKAAKDVVTSVITLSKSSAASRNNRRSVVGRTAESFGAPRKRQHAAKLDFLKVGI